MSRKRKWLMALVTLGALAIGGYASLCGLVYVKQNSLIFFPDHYFAADPSVFGLPFEDFRIKVDDEVEITGWLVERDKTAPWILHFHGNAGNISNRIDHLRLFDELGFNGVVFDYRGYGKSSGIPTESGLVEDGLAVVKYLEEERNVDPDFLIYFGESLGGGVASAVSEKKEPRAMILKSTFTSVPDLASEIYGFLPVRLLARTHFKTKDRVPKMLFPKLVVHGRADTVIGFHHGQKLFQLASEPKQFFEAQGGHNTSPLELGDVFKNTLKDFVLKAVPDEY